MLEGVEDKMASSAPETCSAGHTLSVAFLIGSDNISTRNSIQAICELPNIKPMAILMDTERVPFSRRFKNLRRNVRVNGWKYLVKRLSSSLRELTEGLAFRAAISPHEVQSLLRRAFPHQCFNIEELSERYGAPLYSAGNLNGRVASELLSASKADLGIVLGTRILKRSIFSIPPQGCINLHKGKVPDYRGMPPGFWELFDGAPTAGVTVHFVDDGLDTGDVLATSEFQISTTETPVTLMEKLHRHGILALREAVVSLQDGSAIRRRQPETTNRPRSKPSHQNVAALKKRLPHWRAANDGYRALKNLYALALYYSGGYALVRVAHRLWSSRGAILLYHRVNEYARDPLTADTRIFASHLLALSNRYPTLTTSEFVRRIRARISIPPTTIGIHFDDCYQDVFTNGAPLLAALGLPATAFINSGFVDTARVYPHDARKFPFAFPNLSSREVREWVNLGFEVGNHTVNHVDLGVHPLEEVEDEITQCERELHNITGQVINLFSFPFGDVRNIRDEVVDCIRERGYLALFSAHGGFVTSKTDAFDIPRLGANGDLNPLVLLLEVEGLAPNQVAGYFRQLISRFKNLVVFGGQKHSHRSPSQPRWWK